MFTFFCAGVNTVLASAFQLLVVYRLGVGERSDLYFGATIAVIAIFTLFLDPLNNILIPMFVETDEHEDKVELLWNTILFVVAAGALIGVLTWFGMRVSFPLIYGGLNGANSVSVSRILASYSIYLVLYGGITVKNCYLFASNRPIAAQLNLSVSWIVSLALLYRFEIATDVSRIADCLVAGSIVGLSLPNIGRLRFVFRPKQFRAHLTTLIKRGVLLASGSAVFKAESLLDSAIASFFGAGSLTVYQLFSRMLLSVSTIINSGYIQPVTNHLAEAAKHGHWNALARQARKFGFWASAASVACLLPIVPVLLLLHARPTPALNVYMEIFERHWAVFLLMLGYLIGSVMWKVYATGLIVLRREQTFAVICAATFVIGILFKVAGAYISGLNGLASGTSLYWLLGTTAMAMSFREALKKNRSRSWEGLAAPQPEIIVSAGEAD